MQGISTILSKKIVKVSEANARPVNVEWEQAGEFAKYVGVPTTFVMRLFSKYGVGRVLSLKSWIKDAPSDPKKGGKVALLSWKLKQTTQN